MTNSICQVFGFITVLVSGLGIIISVAMPDWTSDVTNNDHGWTRGYTY